MPSLPQPPTSTAFDMMTGPNPVWTRWFLQVFKRIGGSVGETIPEVSAAVAATQADVAALDGRVGALEAVVINQLPSHVKTALPSATTAGLMIYVSNEAGGPVPAFSDGTNWRRVTDLAVVS